MTDYSDLIERVGKAEGPDREIDADLVRTCCPGSRVSQYLASDEEPSVFHAHTIGLNDRADVPRYTESLDAALSLVDRMLPGWTRSVDATLPEAGIAVDLYPPDQGSAGVRGDHKIEAIATCLALLRALEEKGLAKDSGTGAK